MCCPYGWVFGPTFSKQGSLLGRFSITCVGNTDIGEIVKNGSFSTKIHHKNGYDSKFDR